MPPDDTDKRTCDTCGEPLPGSAKFCSKCGASLDGEGYPEPREEKRGLPTWVWVVIIGGIILVGMCFVILPIAAIAIPNLVEARKTGNETAAIGALRTISSVQAQFREGDRDNDNMLDYATSLAELSQHGLIDNMLGAGVKSGYLFGLSGSTFDWLATATPLSSSTGTRNWIICTDGVVRFSSRGPATCSSPAIQ